MYTERYLAGYPFFEELMQSTDLEPMHDSLTGVLSRPYLLRFVRDLVQRGTPFRLAIVDLDNFKGVNDHYGHHVGDRVLESLASGLRAYVGQSGVVGRFGGDEFLVVTLQNVSYEEAHRFYKGLFDSGEVFRRSLEMEGRNIFATATVGSAAYPADADSFETLFTLADKALYRGKTKGRNCFILYVDSKHRALQFPAVSEDSLYETFRLMAEGFDAGGDITRRLALAFAPMRHGLSLAQLWYLDSAGRVWDVPDGTELGSAALPEVLRERAAFAVSDPKEFEADSGALFGHLRREELEAALFMRVGHISERFGCLVFCPEIHTRHVWLDRDYAAAFLLARMLAQYLRQQERDGLGAPPSGEVSC